ncbi:hypothetical protein DSO57_1021541 [Entomophthora muscae]|uniref:Uncharacterized protein n=1 Tax=Entomophthora muscae TaxID=34485 RepID=A0ACC2SGT3_9FUNG|nr:hypothetical protein DSO57_1021541 [Entomophthora muscae]
MVGGWGFESPSRLLQPPSLFLGGQVRGLNPVLGFNFQALTRTHFGDWQQGTPQMFPCLDKIMHGYAGSSNSEASVYGNSQPACSSPSTKQECVLSPVSSSMALFAHHTQTAANPNHVSTLASGIGQLSQGVTQRSQNPETANQMIPSGSQDRHIPPTANQPASHRRKLITPEIVLKMVKKQGMLMSLGEIAATMGLAKSTVAATLQAHTFRDPLLR